jgi:hypothetical protein
MVAFYFDYFLTTPSNQHKNKLENNILTNILSSYTMQHTMLKIKNSTPQMASSYF